MRKVERCEISEDSLYRYVLQVRIADKSLTNKKLIVIQKNPSTADQSETDATILRVENWARSKGFTTVTYLNLFAYRSTDPRKLNSCKYDIAMGERNDEFIMNEINKDDTVVIGWGNANNINKANYVRRSREVHKLVKKVYGQINIVGNVTVDGNPRHGLLWRNSWDIICVDDESCFSYLKNN